MVHIYWMVENIYKGYSFVAEAENGICGFVTDLPDPDQNAIFVWQLGVLTSHRKQGVAYQLLENVLNQVRIKGYSGIITSIDAINIGGLSRFRKLSKEHNLKSEIIGKYDADGAVEDVYRFYSND